MNKIEKCSITQKGRLVIHKGFEEKRIYKEELQSYLDSGWLKGISDTHRKELSDKRKGKSPYNKGIPCSQEKKQKISNSLKGNIPWNKGLNISDERIKRLSQHSTATKINKYGCAFPNNNMNKSHREKIGNALRGRINGKLTPEKLEHKLQAEYLVKKKNNSFNSSNPENTYYQELLEKYSNKTIYRNYKDKVRYPFYCDFYVKEEDLFIELNLHWTHGGKPYDPNDEECQKQLSIWQEKAKTSQFYQNAIQTWTVRDVEKQRIARKNKLNYKVIY